MKKIDQTINILVNGKKGHLIYLAGLNRDKKAIEKFLRTKLKSKTRKWWENSLRNLNKSINQELFSLNKYGESK